MIAYRPQAKLTGKRLFAHTVASFMKAQGATDPAMLAVDRPMPVNLLHFLLRDTTLKYWIRPDHRWLRADPFGTEMRLTAEGLRKVEDRLAGRPKGQGVSLEQVHEALLLINGGITNEPTVRFETPGQTASKSVSPNLYPDEVADPEEYIYRLRTGTLSLADLQAEFDRQVEEYSQMTPAVRQRHLLDVEQVRPRQVVVTTTMFVRNPAVAAEVLLRSRGHCESCTQAAPFRKRLDGSPYLEVHHRLPLAQGGDDSIANAIAVCPNCHRKAHYA